MFIVRKALLWVQFFGECHDLPSFSLNKCLERFYWIVRKFSSSQWTFSMLCYCDNSYWFIFFYVWLSYNACGWFLFFEDSSLSLKSYSLPSLPSDLRSYLRGCSFAVSSLSTLFIPYYILCFIFEVAFLYHLEDFALVCHYYFPYSWPCCDPPFGANYNMIRS